MALPGPDPLQLGLELVGLAASAAAVGDRLRRPLSRWIPSWRTVGGIERALLGLYLGGAVFYVLATLPLGLFALVPVLVILAGTGVLWVAQVITTLRSGRTRAILAGGVRALRPAPLVAGAAALLLFAVEVVATQGVGTGNTYDASLLTTYTGLLLSHGSAPIALAPVAPWATAYPQGTTAWLGLAQLLLGLPAARGSLLLTPLFLGVFPLAAYVAGSRWFGRAEGGALLAVFFALLAPWTRQIAFGSNDFVLAAPLVLLLLSRLDAWWSGETIGRAEAIGFGALAGYAAALNPVGSEWLLLMVPIGALALGRGVPRPWPRWLVRYGLALGSAVVWVLPSLYALGFAGASGASGSAPSGIGPSDWVGSVDPFLFGSGDQFLSPFPLLRAELAGLIVAGAVLLCTGWGRRTVRERVPATWLFGGALLAVLLAVSVGARAGLPLVGPLLVALSPTEEAIWLFILYSALASIPVWVLLRHALGPTDPAAAGGDPLRHRPMRTAREPSAAVAAVVVLVLILPGAVVTVGSLPGQLRATYVQYGNVTEADLDLLGWAEAHLPSNASVLTAPGSAAEFLPGYAPQVRLVEPMAGGYRDRVPAYWIVVGELTNGTLDAAGLAALRSLGVGYVAVTQANSILFPPFVAAPLEARGWPALFTEGDAALYQVGS